MILENFEVLSTGKITGRGCDGAGEFTWSGTHIDGQITAEKKYKKGRRVRLVYYHGWYDVNN